MLFGGQSADKSGRETRFNVRQADIFVQSKMSDPDISKLVAGHQCPVGGIMEKKYVCQDCEWEMPAGGRSARQRAADHRKKGHTVTLIPVEEGRGMGTPFPLSILKANELVPPEAALRQIGWGYDMPVDGKYQKGVRDGIGLMLVGARMVQVLTAMQAEIVRTQLEVFREAKGESAAAERAAMTAASQTASEIASQLSPKFDQLKTALSPNPILSMFAEVVQPFFQQALQGALRAFFPQAPQQQPSQRQPGVPPGFTLEKLEEE